MTDINKYLKTACMQVGAGGSAGFIEVCIMHPLDLIKTRLQLQNHVTAIDPTKKYKGVWDCMRKMYKYEGFGAFWKGVFPPILAETPKRACKFLTFEQYQRFFLFGASSPTPLTFALAGLGAGITEALLVNPFEVVKVSLQANRSIGAELPSTWTVTRRIIRTEGMGLRGINKGVGATMCRNGLFNMVYFGFYHSVKNILPQMQDPTEEFLRKLSIGFTSGVLGSMFNIPFDVAKSRIQGPQPVPGQIKYRNTLQAMNLVYREEGFRALYKGLVPKMLRLGPGGAIMLVVYEHVFEFLSMKFPDSIEVAHVQKH